MEDHLGPGTGLAAGQVSREGDWGSLYPHQWSLGLLVLLTRICFPTGSRSFKMAGTDILKRHQE